MRKLSITLALLPFACLPFILIALPAHASSSPPRADSVLRTTLDNGLRVVIVRNPLAPAVTTEINYLAGSDETPEGFPGMAHAQEHMMFRGSQRLSADQLAEITAAMGGNFDADTQQNVTQYFFTVPAEDLSVALHVEAERMRGILDSEDQWKQERGAIEQEVAQDLSSPEYKFYSKLLAALFPGTPYAHDALGTYPSFEKTTATMLKRFYDDWYAPNNAVLVIVGDVQPEQTLAEVKALFGDIPARRLPARPVVQLQPLKPTTLRLETDAPYGMSVVAFRLPGSDSPDYAAAQVLADVLSSQRGDLYDLVTTGKALYAGFAETAFTQAGLGYAAAAFPAGGNGDALVREIQSILRTDLAKGFPADLVEAAKRREIARAEFEKNSVAGLATAWSEAVAVENRQSPDDDRRAIAQVSVADVDRVARTYLKLDQSVIAILSPQSSGQPVSAKPIGGKESFSPKNVQQVALPDWAKDALARISIPSSHVHPTVTLLPNGLRLIVQPESVSDTVSVYGQIRNQPDLEIPKDKEGVNEVLDQLFTYGTSSLDRVAFYKALDDIGADESAGIGFSLQVLKSHFERGVQLLADNELHPVFPADAFNIVRKQTAAAIAGRLQSPDYLMSRAMRHALFPATDPVQRDPDPARVSALTLADVDAYYRRAFRPDLTTIVVIGNITPAQARQVIEKYFGNWHAKGPRPITTLPVAPPNQASITAVPDHSRIQDKVTLTETLGLNRFHPDYYALQLGNHVLGGAFYATRLYRDLRKDTGLVYYVDSAFQVGRTRALYVVDYACDPPNVGRARAIVEHDLQTLRETPVSPEELRQAKALLLREIPLSESSTDSIAQGLLSRSVHRLPLDEPLRAARRYMATTADDVQRAFAKWVKPDRLVQITEGPVP